MTAPLGFISLATQNMINSLGDCAEWRDWVGASGGDVQAQARARVYREALAPGYFGKDGAYGKAELIAARPFAIVANETAVLTAAGSPAATSDSGALTLEFHDNVPEAIADDHAEIALRFENRLGVIAAELLALNNTAGYLSIGAIELLGWGRNDRAEAQSYGDAVEAVVRVEWGEL